MARKPSREDEYVNPLVTRYASREMSATFSPQRKHATWRRLWLALAEAEHELGLPVSQAQLAQMRAHLDDIDFKAVARYEKRLRHDVMAHVHAFADQCPKARPINLIDALAAFADEHKGLVTLGFTHYQPAQPTTVGKRASLWLYDVVLDYQEAARLIDALPFRSVKGTTGTQDSFLELFDGDHAKVRKLERLVAAKMGFRRIVPVSGQTYTRKLDSQVLGALVGIAESGHKMGTDIRLLSNLRELSEPFGSKQIGSSAMPHKRNPMRCERMCSLARHVIAVAQTAPMTAATQWLERTLDDSAGRRIAIPEAFLGADAILILATNVARGMAVHPEVIARRLADEAPFLATERVLMAAVKAGGDRQALHERLRRHAVAARTRMLDGEPNDLADRLRGDGAFADVRGRIDELMDPDRLAGRAPRQVTEFLRSVVRPILRRDAGLLGIDSSLNV